MLRKIALSLLAALAGLCMIACSPGGDAGVTQETDEKHFQRGMRLLREGREDEALNSFLKVIDKRSDAAESHLEAGILYQKHIGDPVTAIYHYRRFVELRPESPEAQRVDGLIQSAQKDFAKTLSGQPFRNDIDRLDLLEIVETARAENTELKKQVADLKKRLNRYESTQVSTPTAVVSSRQPAAAQVPVSTTSQTAASAGRTYAVSEGDTLSRISIKVYGTPGRWMDIYDANRDSLPNPNALRIGQELKIPE